MADPNLNIYSARLTFKKESKEVIIDIRYNKIEEARRRKIQIPDNIDLYELKWIKYRKQVISTYHRIIKDNTYEYKDQEHTIAPISLSQKLERLVSDTCSFILKKQTEKQSQ